MIEKQRAIDACIKFERCRKGRQWKMNSEWHRDDDGPAIVRWNGSCAWFYLGDLVRIGDEATTIPEMTR